MNKIWKGTKMIVANIMLVLAVIVFYIFTFTIVPLVLIAQADPSCLSTFEWAVTPLEKFVNLCGGSMFKD